MNFMRIGTEFLEGITARKISRIFWANFENIKNSGENFEETSHEFWKNFRTF